MQRKLLDLGFYSPEYAGDTAYSRDPTGATPDFVRLHSGQQNWFRVRQKRIHLYKKKALVVTDPAAIDHAEELKKLFNDGFEIFLSTKDGEIIQITEIQQLDNLLDVKYKSSEVIKHEMLQRGYGTGKIKILDHTELNKLQNPFPSWLNIFNCSTIDRLKENDYLQNAILRLKGSVIGLVRFYGNTEIEKELLAKAAPLAGLETQANKFLYVMREYPAHKDSLEYLSIQFHRNDEFLESEVLAYIQTLINLRNLNLRVDSYKAINIDFNNLLNKLVSLESLTLINVKIKNSLKNTDKLKHLELNMVKIASQASLPPCPRLETLIIKTCDNINFLMNADCKNLKKLYLSGITMDVKDFMALLNQDRWPNLEELELKNITLKGNLENLDEEIKCLKNLKKFSFNGFIRAENFNREKMEDPKFKIHSKFIAAIIANNEALEDFDVSQCLLPDMSHEVFIPTNRKLSRLILGGVKIEGNFLAYLLSNLNNIEILEINGFIENYQDFSKNFPKLKSLEIYPRTIRDAIEILEIANHSFNLEELSLRMIGGIFAQGASELERFTFKHDFLKLKRLNLRLAPISDIEKCSIFYQELMARCRHLTELNLNINSFLEEATDHVKIGGENLRKAKIEFNYNKLKTTNYTIGLLENSPNLQKIHWIWGGFPQDFSLSDTCQLLHLAEIHLEKTNITNENLKMLIAHCPNLKKITLEKCQGLIRDAELEEMLARLEESHFNEFNFSTNSSPNAKETAKKVSSKRINKNTKSPEKVFDVTEYFREKPKGFFTPKPIYYRLNVHELKYKKNKVTFSKIKSSLRKLNIGFNRLARVEEAYEKSYENTIDHFYGTMSKLFKPGMVYALPSLTPVDELIQFGADTELDVSYNDAENMFYVSLPEGTTKEKIVTTNFIVKVPEDKAPEFYYGNQPFQSKKINNLVKHYTFPKDSSRAELKLPENATDYDILQAVKTQRKGACFHRNMAFLDAANEAHIEARAIESESHAFIEVYEQERWQRVDLGGHPGSQNVKKMAAIPKPEEVKNGKKPSTQQQPLILLQDPSLAIDNPFLNKEAIDELFTSYEEYAEWLLDAAEKYPPHKRNLLVRLPNDNEIEKFNSAMMRVLKRRDRKHTYIHHLGDFNRKEVALKPNGSYEIIDSATISSIKQSGQGDSFMLNWRPQDFGFNSLMDDKRLFDEAEVAEGVLVLALVSDERARQMGRDFFSRFPLKSRIQSPLSSDKDTTFVAQVTVANKEKNAEIDDDKSVNLFDGLDWEEDLLGALKVKGEHFNLMAGALIKASLEGWSMLEIVNGPWDDLAFRLFCEEVMIKKEFQLYGEVYKLKEDFMFVASTKPYDFSQGYDISSFTPETIWEYPLNSKTYNNFFKNLICHNEVKNLAEEMGWLEANQNGIISVLVTETFSDAEWSKLLEQAKKYHCRLVITAAPGVKLPNAMHKEFSPPITRRALTLKALKNTVEVIVSDDIDYTVQLLKKTQGINFVKSINEGTGFEDLIEYLKYNKLLNGKYEFESITSPLLKALREGKTVVLKGGISNELAAKLESLFAHPSFLLINGKKEYLDDLPGRLLFVTDNKSAFSFVPTSFQHLVKDEDRWLALSEEFGPSFTVELQQMIAKINQHHETHFTYVQLQEMLQQLKAGEVKNIFKPYLILEDNPESLIAVAKEIWAKHLEHVGIEINKNKSIHAKEKRLEKVKSMLDKNQFICIVGESGVGKTSFVLKDLKQFLKKSDKKKKIYSGESQFITWLENGGVFFIDEFNMQKNEVTAIFEGFSDDPPGHLYKGKFYPLTKDHQMLALGNFSHFVGRTKHSFFQRHGGAIIFKEFPDHAIFEYIIAPLLIKGLADTEVNSNENIKKMGDAIIKMYRFVNQSLPRQQRLTSRNLEAICLRLALYIDQNKHKMMAEDTLLMKQYHNDPLHALVCMAIYDEIANKSLDKEALAILKKDFAAYQTPIPQRLGDYLVTDTREEPVRQMLEQLHIRELKRKKQMTAAGLTGILLEGPSSAGKSKMVVQLLRELGYRDSVHEAHLVQDGKSYTYIPANHPNPELLATANIAIREELNQENPESTLNPILDRHRFKTKAVQNDDLFLFATQNDLTFANRQALSPAMENRFLKIYLHDYTKDELILIVKDKGLSSETAEHLVDQFLYATYLCLKNEETLPTARDLFNEADKLGLRREKGKEKEKARDDISPHYSPTIQITREKTIESPLLGVLGRELIYPLHEAIVLKDLNKIMQLLEIFDLLQRDQTGRTPLDILMETESETLPFQEIENHFKKILIHEYLKAFIRKEDAAFNFLDELLKMHFQKEELNNILDYMMSFTMKDSRGNEKVKDGEIFIEITKEAVAKAFNLLNSEVNRKHSQVKAHVEHDRNCQNLLAKLNRVLNDNNTYRNLFSKKSHFIYQFKQELPHLTKQSHITFLHELIQKLDTDFKFIKIERLSLSMKYGRTHTYTEVVDMIKKKTKELANCYRDNLTQQDISMVNDIFRVQGERKPTKMNKYPLLPETKALKTKQ